MILEICNCKHSLGLICNPTKTFSDVDCYSIYNLFTFHSPVRRTSSEHSCYDNNFSTSELLFFLLKHLCSDEPSAEPGQRNANIL